MVTKSIPNTVIPITYTYHILCYNYINVTIKNVLIWFVPL